MKHPPKHRSKIRQKLENSGDSIRRARLPKRMRISAKILDALKEQGMSNLEFANKLKKYSSEITKWLKGDHNFTTDTLSDIEEVLGISLLSIDNSKRKEVSNHILNISLEVKVGAEDEEDAAKIIAESGGRQISSYKKELTLS